MMNFLNNLFGRNNAAKAKEASDIVNERQLAKLLTDAAFENLNDALVYAQKQIKIEKERGDSLLKAVDKARAERNEANNKLSTANVTINKLSSELSVTKKQLTGVLEMKGISEEEAGQLWGASNNEADFGTQSRVLWREGKKAFRAHQMAVSETFDAMEKHLKQGKTLKLDDVQYYRVCASDAIGRKI